MPFNIIIEPLISRKFTQWLCMPSSKATEKARKKIKPGDKAIDLVRDFYEGRIIRGTLLEIGKEKFEFVGAHPKTKFPEAMCFYNHTTGVFKQFNYHDLFSIVYRITPT